MTAFIFSAKIQSLKKAVTKGDKRKKKESTEEIAKLEEKLKSLEAYKATLDVSEGGSCEASVTREESVTCEDVSTPREQLSALFIDEKQEGGVATGNKKKSKAQRRKVKH